jgi:hypothetical protein
MSIIDEKGAKSISNWFKDKKDTKHTISFGDFNINVDNDQELGTLKLILMRNDIKFVVDNPPFSEN